MHRRTLEAAMLIVSVGAWGFLGLSCARADSAKTDSPTINVTATLPGQSAERIAATITTPLERQLGRLTGVRSLTSNSRKGESSITIQFEPGRGMDAAARDVQAAIMKAGSTLPSEMPSPPAFTKGDPADPPILFLPVVSATAPLVTLDEYAETVMAQRIAMTSGVGRVLVYGAARYAIRIQLDPYELAKYALALDEVEAAMRSGVQSQHPKAASELGNMTVASRNGVPVSLQQIGRVIDGIEDEKTAAWFNDRRAVILGIQQQPGSNAAEVVAAVRKLVPDLRARMPQSVNFDVVENLTGTDSVLGSVEAAEGTPFEQLRQYQMQAANLVRQNPAVESVISSVNAYSGQLFLHLRTLKEWPRDVDVIEELRPRLAVFPGFRVHLRKSAAVPLRYVLTGTDFAELAEWKQKVEHKLSALLEVRDITDDFSTGPEAVLQVDRDKAAVFGIPEARIEAVLSVLYGDHRIGNGPVAILELEPKYRQYPETLSKLLISGTGGKLVPLSALARWETRSGGPKEIHHSGQFPSITISFGLRPGYNIEKTIAELGLPATVNGRLIR